MQQDSKRILVVEDEGDVAGLLRARLESRGYEVLVEERGRDALQNARTFQPDLVVLDLMLPDMDGYGVSEELRKHFGPWTVPILMLTAKDRPRDKLRGYGAGADAYLTKPYDALELLSIIARLLHDVDPD